MSQAFHKIKELIEFSYAEKYNDYYYTNNKLPID